MIPVRSFRGRTCAVFGLGTSGLAAAHALKVGGADVLAWDDTPAARQAAGEFGVTVRPWQDWDWSRLDALILSPGVPLTHPEPHEVVVRARDAGIEIIGDIDLFAREIRPDPAAAGRAPVIAVTGTNGKSTTVALIGHILKSCGYQAELGGNFGRPVLSLPAPGSRTVYVIEVSSYQIDLSPSFVPDVSVLTNITPDHIDRHGSFDHYASVKGRLLRQTAKDGLRVIGVDNPQTASIFTALMSARLKTVPVSAGKVLSQGIFVVHDIMYEARTASTETLMDMADAPRLIGVHNAQNAALAFAATRSFVKNGKLIADAIGRFPGLAHRIEDIGTAGRVKLVNDSKATNADAAMRALACFDDVYWIAGGRPKAGGIQGMEKFWPRIRKAYLIGEAADDFAVTLEGHVPYEKSGTLETAFASACDDAMHSDANHPVVLLSPACASFDQFTDFEARGEAFRSLAKDAIAAAFQEAS